MFLTFKSLAKTRTQTNASFSHTRILLAVLDDIS